MANPINYTRLAELTLKNEAVIRAGMAAIKIPENILINEVLNPNYVSPDHQTPILVVAWLSTAIPLVCVILRFVARFMTYETSIGPDDWFALAAWITNTGFVVNTIWSVKMGATGKHLWLLTDLEMHNAYKASYIHPLLLNGASFFLHLSIMFFYLRIIPKDHWARKVLYGFFVFHFISTPVHIFLFAFQCHPTRSAWDLEHRLQLGTINHCMNSAKLTLSLTIIDIVTDVALVMIPISVVWKLSLNLRQKVMVSGLFGLAAVACIVSGIRLVFLKSYFKSFDRTFDVIGVNVCGHLEIALGLICACLPMIRQVFVKMKPDGGIISSITSRMSNSRLSRGIASKNISSRSGSHAASHISSKRSKLTYFGSPILSEENESISTWEKSRSTVSTLIHTSYGSNSEHDRRPSSVVFINEPIRLVTVSSGRATGPTTPPKDIGTFERHDSFN